MNAPVRHRRAALLCAIGLTSCDFFGTASREEVVRLPSPNGKIDAVVIEINSGATDPCAYEIRIVPHSTNPGRNKPAAFLLGAVRNPSAYGVNLVWLSPARLAVEYDFAKISSLDHPIVTIRGSPVAVELQSGRRDPSAPSGGMGHNLHKQH